MCSQFGCRKGAGEKQYRFDFISYSRRNLDWYAFVFILLVVNIMIMYLNSVRLHEQDHEILTDEEKKEMVEGNN